MENIPTYEVYAIKYAEIDRHRRENFIRGDQHDGPMPMDFFIWVIKRGSTVVLVDTGFSHEEAALRGRSILRCPIDGLSDIGVDAAQINDAVLTHLHYDHAGNIDKLPSATFHLQESEMSFATGRCMCFPAFRFAYTAEHVATLIHRLYADRVSLHSGAWQLYPGIEIEHIGGHTAGLQIVRVHTEAGWVVLASDAAHYYENFESERPFPLVHDVERMLIGQRKLAEYAARGEAVIPGHDPLVMERYTKLPEHRHIVRLDISASH